MVGWVEDAFFGRFAGGNVADGDHSGVAAFMFDRAG